MLEVQPKRRPPSWPIPRIRGHDLDEAARNLRQSRAAKKPCATARPISTFAQAQAELAEAIAQLRAIQQLRKTTPLSKAHQQHKKQLRLPFCCAVGICALRITSGFSRPD